MKVVKILKRNQVERRRLACRVSGEKLNFEDL
jgi:hypothetical protein